MDNLGYIDFVFLGIVAFMAIRGFLAGFWREVCGVLGLILGVFMASRYAYDAGRWFEERVFALHSETFATLIGFVGILVLVWGIFVLASKILVRLGALILPRYLNGILGALFGMIQAFVAIGILLHFVFRLDFMHGTLEHFGSHSIIYPRMESVASKIVAVDIMKNIPTDKTELKQKMDSIKEGISEAISEGAKGLEQKLGEIAEKPIGELK